MEKSLTTMFRFLMAVFLAGALVGCSAVPTLPVTASAPERDSFLDTWVERVLAGQQEAQAPGVVLLVVKDGKPVLVRSKGLADQTHQLDEHSVFDVGSLSKPITAIAVMQLVEARRLGLDDSILAWIPELPASWKAVTIHHLLSHQSGIPDLTRVTRATVGTLSGLSNQDLIRRYREVPLAFAPGSRADYANTNYNLLAEVVARASGQSYAAYLKQHVFAPAGMRSTYVRGDTPELAQTMALNYARTVQTYGIDFATLGAIGIRSSVSDLQRLVDHLLAGGLVSRQALAAMTRPQSTHRIAEEGYGYGFFVRPDSAPLTMFAHTGEMDGYRAYLRVNLSKGVYYIVLSNGGARGASVMHNLVATIQMAYERD